MLAYNKCYYSFAFLLIQDKPLCYCVIYGNIVE